MREQWKTSAFTVLLLLGVACDRTAYPSFTAAVPDSTGNVALTLRGACDNCIRLNRIATLGDTDGPGYLQELEPRVVRDRIGRYWVFQPGIIRVFGKDGAYIRDVGRAGRGPLEFSDPWPLHVDDAGNVHVLDAGNGRVSIIGPNFELVRDASFRGVAGFNDAVRVPGGYLINAWMQTTEGIGQPLHIFDDTSTIRSFGASPDQEVIDPPSAMRVLATGTSEHIISSKRFEYAVEIWTLDGRRVIGLTGPQLNSRPVRPTFYGPDNPLPSEIVHMRTDGRWLWVLIRMPREDWTRHIVEHVYPSGHVGYKVRDGRTYASLYKSRIDIIDLERRVIAASRELDGMFSRFTEDGLLIRNDWTPEGSPFYSVWELKHEP